jgi:hypothetical protein
VFTAYCLFLFQNEHASGGQPLQRAEYCSKQQYTGATAVYYKPNHATAVALCLKLLPLNVIIHDIQKHFKYE